MIFWAIKSIKLIYSFFHINKCMQKAKNNGFTKSLKKQISLQFHRGLHHFNNLLKKLTLRSYRC